MFGTDRSIRLIFKSRFNGSLLPFEEMEESWFISETWYIAKWLILNNLIRIPYMEPDCQ